jgi:hypothetical protein
MMLEIMGAIVGAVIILFVLCAVLQIVLCVLLTEKPTPSSEAEQRYLDALRNAGYRLDKHGELKRLK